MSNERRVHKRWQKGLQSVVNPGKAGKEERKIKPLP